MKSLDQKTVEVFIKFFITIATLIIASLGVYLRGTPVCYVFED